MIPNEMSNLEKLRHSAAHVMADAVKRIFPEAKITIGPPIENGFYYDFDVPQPFTDEDLEKIEAEMKTIISGKLPFEMEEIDRDAARELFAAQNEDYKLEILDGIPAGEQVSLCRHGEFVDLCRGGHVEHTGQIKAFKLTGVAGAYWRGDENNKMLQRIYGTAFPDRKQLRGYLTMLEEAKKRDHRRLGKELDLFSFSETIGAGLVLWHPKGALIRHHIESYWREQHLKNGYELLYTPHIAKDELWKQSGHLGFYNENMYAGMEIDGQEYLAKPMNCPFHINIYKSDIRSYRDLPLRWAELGTVYRYEKAGVLHGLLRVRGFTQDDAHIFCTPEQIEDEIREVLRFSTFIWKTFGFEQITAYLSTRPEKAVGSARWEQATTSLENALKASGLPYETDIGGGAFYGPKIDLKIKDAIGRAGR
jgi:threonyl-tRNA synthetase